MADSKITALTAISTVDPTADPLVIVDVSDTSMAASGTTKKSTINQLLGSGGTATLASATITGDLTVDTSTLKVDSANDNVIVGATSAIGGGRFSVQADLSAKQAICAKNSAASYSATNNFIRFTNSTDATVGGITHPAVTSLGVWGVSDIQFLLSGAGTTAMTLNSTGLNIANGNVILGTSGKGIDFSATSEGSGTMTSELLNDYEEGTFTPTVVGSTTAGVGVYTTQVGKYTKIGNQVIASAYISLTAHTGTGNLRLSGLPFTNSAEANSFSAVDFGLVNNLALTAGNILTGYTSVGNVFIECSQTPTGGGASSAVPIDVSFDVIYSVTYRV